MANSSKKYGFLPDLPRHFTREGTDAWSLINFTTSEDGEVAFERPDNWSTEATAVFAGQAASVSIPASLKAIEENTVPSWLWRHTGDGRFSTGETSAKQVFDRVVGAAVYAGWKAGLFSNEVAARGFFDEARYALAQRFIALDMGVLARAGLDWAYGEKVTAESTPSSAPTAVEISNAAIDAIVGGKADKNVRAQWQRLTPSIKNQFVTARFSDIASDWAGTSAHGPKAVIDLLALRNEDGGINGEALRHAARMIVILYDLLEAGETIEIGFCNLAALLMTLALPYDSPAARAYAASIAAVITAEAYATSAELAGLRGIGEGFTAGREAILRSLRNRRRAAYGDRNDYEKISVLPAALVLADCPDLALAASAREGWEKALALAQENGLRAIQVTALFSVPALTLFTESSSQGVAPLPALCIIRAESEEVFRRDVHPAVAEALAKLGYGASEKDAILRHIAGHGTLLKAPAINHINLRGKGFDAGAIQRVEDYLPYVDDIRLAFTPWIVGEEFCAATLKIPAAKFASPRFELLKHLGFTPENISAANAFCYGHGTACNVNTLKLQHIAVFTRGDEISPEARIRMAGAIQSLVSGEVELVVGLPVGTPAGKSEKLLLAAWLQGVKSLTLEHIPSARPAVTDSLPKRDAASPFLHAKKSALPERKAKPKAASKLAGLAKPKPGLSQGKRH